ncbi:3-hydroxybutyryl-CoA dehydratase [Desulfosarcina alkanivorans]|uniref:3-hydroxybutyryl-CoA dehydratase n=1 Tax=Desulfosarcina alkanivorans TaxID=571177 RepID=A0A5K7YP55_9BACT|nr:enoyl-CoA hydratase/isomerase family protein [Desulfosarcina alkanivorans]BBO71562.1 3-hydroxybutyryl-CoA dehydratase [Desulfosarcina alkanivorans]
MASEGIAVEKKGPLALVSLRRPDRRNAFNRAMFRALEDAARKLATPPLPRAVVVTGAGPDAFCAGFDVNPDNPMVAEMMGALEQGERGPIERSIGVVRSAVDRFVELPVPIIAAINGSAFGGGAELAVRCDLRVMDPDAELCFSEVRLGLMPDWGGGAALTHLIGSAASADLILTARRVGADEALRIGLANRISPPGKALETAVEMAGAIMRNGPQAVRSALTVIRAGRELSLQATLDMERRTAVDLIASGECLHGIGAFLTGQAPAFPDPPPEGPNWQPGGSK